MDALVVFVVEAGPRVPDALWLAELT